jgi:hypothetical protein
LPESSGGRIRSFPLSPSFHRNSILTYHLGMNNRPDRKSWSSGSHFYLVSGRSRGRLSAPATGYTDWGFSWFSSDPPGEYRDSTLQLGHTASYQILSNSSPYPLIDAPIVA